MYLREETGKRTAMNKVGASMLTVALLLTAESRDAQAQEAVSTITLEEIVVTARKRSENLQQTPIAISAIGSREIEARGYSNISNIDQSVPNITFQPTASNSGSANAAVIFIRGVGQSDFYPGVDPGVGVYLDGVYIARTTGSVLDSVELEQIEVLKGPQGTLFGRNTIGGALNITTKKPDEEARASISAKVGSYDRIDVKASVNLPVSDKFFTSFSFASLNRDGYIKLLDLAGNEQKALGDINKLTARFAAHWDVTDTLEADFSFDWTRGREESSGSSLLNVDVNGISAGFHNGVAAPTLVGELGDYAIFSNQYVPDDPYVSYGSPGLSKSDLDLWGVSATLTWALTENVDVKSISAYRASKSDNFRDGDNTPLLILHPATLIDQTQFSQEIQLSGEAFDGRLNWLAGGYYLTEDIAFAAPVDITFITLDNSATIKNESIAFFSQGSYDVTDRFGVTAGIRWTEDKKRNVPSVLATRSFSLDPLPEPIPFLIDDQTVKFNDITPAIILDYEITDDIFVYGSFSKGFKSGGFSQRIAFPRTEAPSFRPETVKSFEAGLKLTGLDGRLRMNGAVFYAKYNDLQAVVFNQVEPLIKNAGEAEILGFELETTFQPVEAFRFGMNIGLTNGNYLSIEPDSLIPDGAELSYTPKWTLSSYGSYIHDLGDHGSITFRTDWAYKSETFLDALNSPDLAQKGYHIVNMNMTYTDVDDVWGVSLGVTNLTKTVYLVGGFSDLITSSFSDGTYARPREWYLSVHRNF